MLIDSLKKRSRTIVEFVIGGIVDRQFHVLVSKMSWPRWSYAWSREKKGEGKDTGVSIPNCLRHTERCRITYCLSAQQLVVQHGLLWISDVEILRARGGRTGNEAMVIRVPVTVVVVYRNCVNGRYHGLGY